MAVSSGPGTVNSGLVFAYDMANREKSFLGAPATNTCSFVSYSYVWDNGVVTRNTTAPISPPVTGYEIAKLQSTDGLNTQTILYTAGVDQVNGGVYTHSAWIYLESGTWASVGQHWNPWDYGTWQYITPGRWTRISYTLTNSPNNYGNVALSYNTNGTIYITASQYEKAPFMGKFIGGAGATRTNTQSLLDLTGQNTITANSLTYNTDGTFNFNGSSDYISMPSLNLQRNFSLECWAYITDDVSGIFGQGVYTGNQGLHILWYYPGNRGMIFGMYGNDLDTPSYNLIKNNWNHFVFTYNHSTFLKQFYANGVLINSGALYAYSGSGQFNIGVTYSDPSPNVKAKGKISLARCYSKVLTADEVAQNFAATRSRYGI